IAWPEKGTALIIPAAMDGDKAYLSDVMKKGSSVKDNKVLIDLLNSADTTLAFWAAGQIPEEAAKQMVASLVPDGKQKLLGGYAGVGFSGGLKATVGLRFDSDPKPVADKIIAQLETAKKNGGQQAAELPKHVSITTAANDVVVKVDRNEQQLDQIVEQTKSFLPMIMSQFR